MSVSRAMRWTAVAAFAVLGAGAVEARPAAPLHDAASLNIGLSCQWQQSCIKKQKKAMNRALKYVRKYRPPTWRIQLCNRNAARKRYRVDWVGFDNCIRNAALRPAPARSFKKRARPVTQRAVPASGGASRAAIGERG